MYILFHCKDVNGYLVKRSWPQYETVDVAVQHKQSQSLQCCQLSQTVSHQQAACNALTSSVTHGKNAKKLCNSSNS